MEEVQETFLSKTADEKPLAVVYNRTDTMVILTSLISIAMLFSPQLIIVGISGILIVGCFLFTSKKEKVIEIYPDQVILHKTGHPDRGWILPIQTISKWQILNGQKIGTQVHFMLIDGQHTAVETLAGWKAYSILHKALPDQEYTVISTK